MRGPNPHAKSQQPRCLGKSATSRRNLLRPAAPPETGEFRMVSPEFHVASRLTGRTPSDLPAPERKGGVRGRNCPAVTFTNRRVVRSEAVRVSFQAEGKQSRQREPERRAWWTLQWHHQQPRSSLVAPRNGTKATHQKGGAKCPRHMCAYGAPTVCDWGQYPPYIRGVSGP